MKKVAAYEGSKAQRTVDAINRYLTILCVSSIALILIGAILGTDCVDRGTVFEGCFVFGIEFGPLIWLAGPILISWFFLMVVIDLIGRIIYLFASRKN